MDNDFLDDLIAEVDDNMGDDFGKVGMNNTKLHNSDGYGHVMKKKTSPGKIKIDKSPVVFNQCI